MKLILSRNQKSSGLLSKTVTFYLDVRADLTQEERANIQKYKLGDSILYERGTITDPGSGLLGLASRVAFKAMNISISVADLVAAIHSAGRLAMADIARVEEAHAAAAQGADVIATTLSGYTVAPCLTSPISTSCAVSATSECRSSPRAGSGHRLRLRRRSGSVL